MRSLIVACCTVNAAVQRQVTRVLILRYFKAALRRPARSMADPSPDRASSPVIGWKAPRFRETVGEINNPASHRANGSSPELSEEDEETADGRLGQAGQVKPDGGRMVPIRRSSRLPHHPRMVEQIRGYQRRGMRADIMHADEAVRNSFFREGHYACGGGSERGEFVSRDKYRRHQPS